MSRRIPKQLRIPRLLADVLKEVKIVFHADVTFTDENILNFNPASFNLHLDDKNNVALVYGNDDTTLVFEKAGNGVRRYTNKLVRVKTRNV